MTRKFQYRDYTLFARRKTGQRTRPENNSGLKGIVIKSSSLLIINMLVRISATRNDKISFFKN